MTDRKWYFHLSVLARVRAAIIQIQVDLMLLHSAPHAATPLLGGSLGGTFISFLASQFLCCLFGKILVFAPRLPARESAVSRHQQQTSEHNLFKQKPNSNKLPWPWCGAGRKFPRSDPKLQTERRTERGGLPAAIRVRLAARHIINLNHVSCSLWKTKM